MKPVTRSEILDYQTYSEQRPRFRAEAMRQKQPRRIHCGKYLTFLFENHDTIRYQIQEMMRSEQIVREAAIEHEIKTYNELIGGPGELGCTLLIEIEDAASRDVLLKQWLPLPSHLYLKLGGGKKVYAQFDPRQVGEDRLSSVQYLKFDTGGSTPVAIGSDFDLLPIESALSPEQVAALGTDLSNH